MKPIAIVGMALILTVGIPSAVESNCADDAVNTCNSKHPDADESDGAYEQYELCIKAQLGQNCPSGSAEAQQTLTSVEEARAGFAPTCPRGYELKVNWKDNQDWCVKPVPRRAKFKPTR